MDTQQFLVLAFLLVPALRSLTVVDSVLMPGLGPGSEAGGEDLLQPLPGLLVGRFVEGPSIWVRSVFFSWSDWGPGGLPGGRTAPLST